VGTGCASTPSDRTRRGAATPVPAGAQQSLIHIVDLAKDGDRQAMAALVDRHQGVVWRATADMGLSPEDRQDVFAATFCRLFEHLGAIREPVKLPGWLATTARNEVRQVLRAKRRTQPREEIEPGEPVLIGGLDEAMLDGELRNALGAAFLRLRQPCQELLRLTTAVPSISYEQISELTGIPLGSIGPTRQRCLEHLRRAPELRPFMEGGRP
jgi:RNA polymerase sigma factor (sigma-70 family)